MYLKFFFIDRCNYNLILIISVLWTKFFLSFENISRNLLVKKSFHFFFFFFQEKLDFEQVIQFSGEELDTS